MTDREDVVIVGAGHNGLAMSARLSALGVDHVVLERDTPAASWRRQRWDSFRLLTPNWQTRLPGFVYDGDDPDGFMTGVEIADLLAGYAQHIAAPVRTGVEVRRVGADGDGFVVETSVGSWSARAVVLAGGTSNLPNPPPCATDVPAHVTQVNPLDYRSPDDLPEGGVLVVGGASTGIQLAEEIQRSGRPVTLSLGEHVRMPRTYRGRDIQHWMEATGRLDERYDEVPELRKVRAVASPQLIGSPDRHTVDLNRLSDLGVALRGRLGTIRDGVALFSGGLANHVRLADQKLTRLLDEIDEWIDQHGITDVGAPERFADTSVPRGAPLTLDLTTGRVAAIVWATGFKPDLSWVDLPVFDDDGRLVHDGGVVAPGVCALGATFLRRRRSSFIHGSEADTADLADHLVGHLRGR